jgi:hypothetical protein
MQNQSESSIVTLGKWTTNKVAAFWSDSQSEEGMKSHS